MPDSETKFKYSTMDFLLACVGLPLILADKVLDILTIVSFYKQKAYVYASILLVIVIGSTMLLQTYSWLWYKYDEFKRNTDIEKSPSKRQLKLLHIFQLGFIFRYLGLLEAAVKCFYKNCSKHKGVRCCPSAGCCASGTENEGRCPPVEAQHPDTEDVRCCLFVAGTTKKCCPFVERECPNIENVAVFLAHDINILKLIQSLSENTPQLTVILTSILQRGLPDHLTVLKTIVSALSIASCLTSYYRSLSKFLPRKKKTEEIIAFATCLLSNLLLISSRLTALALFASVLPCFIFAHFICSWLIFFFFAWRLIISKHPVMKCPFGVWLYRANIGLLWYFEWFGGGIEKKSEQKVLYHGFMLADISILCGVWYWKVSTDPPDFVILHLHAIITATCIVAVYIFGLLLKVIYFKYFAAKLSEVQNQNQNVAAANRRSRKKNQNQNDLYQVGGVSSAGLKNLDSSIIEQMLDDMHMSEPRNKMNQNQNKLNPVGEVSSAKLINLAQSAMAGAGATCTMVHGAMAPCTTVRKLDDMSEPRMRKILDRNLNNFHQPLENERMNYLAKNFLP